MKAKIDRTSFGLPKADEPPHETAIWNEENKCWELEVNTIDDLLKLGRIVLQSAWTESPYDIDIEIYDDYRE